ncbi:hypothetical protein MPTK1_8g12610 [Marchantia polymorpha subsp. ruderalis]|uniref:Uncharacterized protein n=1 Tax=Marchantia polymorpha TaxID=3197 RepID=A0A2R6WJU3_MARPO|nr:hypothetical protein MARPO_0083s0059 [Marchantia polymorpha]PTQ34099.1 hypothetical protein MARPO_0083s0059 [Marchantia polymorpha]BBN19668.1 hypothetical protein Mp_8g12610 [Marchantia polymorpha subsp. ruderalis]BBN19669.1 hypothetical protein Mp_8g12610 [Marchantia polymorpha subsp. ruderalis]|eukprot:PTQ34098.1 hypothetical protein MARPO_0083s0059 [Marchantia polymorpha]
MGLLQTSLKALTSILASNVSRSYSRKSRAALIHLGQSPQFFQEWENGDGGTCKSWKDLNLCSFIEKAPPRGSQKTKRHQTVDSSNIGISRNGRVSNKSLIPHVQYFKHGELRHLVLINDSNQSHPSTSRGQITVLSLIRDRN